MSPVDRRSLLKSAALLSPLLLPISRPLVAASAPPETKSDPAPRIGDSYPAQDPDMVREMVGVSHFSLEKVTALVERHPTLAKASWDWGFGDWETALGAASHTGQKAIARFLIDRGAPPTLFSAAMLGQLEVVKTALAASPGVERMKGPHGIPLIAHARAGGEDAAAVLEFLQALERPADQAVLAPLSEEDIKKVCGTYSFGKRPQDQFEVSFADEKLGIARAGGTRRFLFHRGDYQFYPSGAEPVRIAFTVRGGRAQELLIYDPDLVVRAIRR